MDKFGFFNLLNSFFQKNFPNEQKNDSNKSGSPDFLADLFSNINKQSQPDFSSSTKTPNLSPSPKPSTEKQTTFSTPLQSNMLSTMANHDHFVKRVKEKHKS